MSLHRMTPWLSAFVILIACMIFAIVIFGMKDVKTVLMEKSGNKPKLNKLRYVNSIVTDYDHSIRSRMDNLMNRELTQDDPELLSVIRELIDPPSQHMLKTVRQVVETPQSKEIMTVLNQMKHGFFVEAGGLDGERSSNTLWLEQKMGWTGLLIEMDPYFYTQLRGKNRKCWSINACISPLNRPTMLRMKESTGGRGVLSISGKSGPEIPCFTLESLLAALNTTTVNYFSLDVEGFELDVLKTIDFKRLNIRMLSVEYVHGKSPKKVMADYMIEHGYKVHKDIQHREPRISLFVDDFIFIKE